MSLRSTSLQRNRYEKEDVLFALDAIATPLSLYEPVYQDGGDTLYLMDQVKIKKTKKIAGWNPLP